MEIENQQIETFSIGYPVGYPERQLRNQPSGYHAIQKNEATITIEHPHDTLNNITNLVEDSDFDELTTTKKIMLIVISILFVVIFFVQVRNIDDARVPDISVQSMSMFPLNLSSHESNTFSRLNISVVPHKTGQRIAYDMVEVALLYDKKIVSSVKLHPFYQENDVQTFLGVNFTSSSLHMKDSTKAIIIKDWIDNKYLHFEVDIQALVRINPETEHEQNGWMEIICDNVQVFPLFNTFSRGKLGEIRSCDVSLKGN